MHVFKGIMMSIKIYNTLTKRKEDFIPIDAQGKQVNMYTCGVTVYDKCHIGHARSLYVFDVIQRYLSYRGYQVRFVRNITDIDDKIINRANELKKDWKDVVSQNIAGYHQDLLSLGIKDPDAEPCATENISEMIDAVAVLIEKGYAYVADGDVYFRVRKFQDYGKLSGQGIENMLEAVRVEKDSKKQDPLDFALWKASKEGEPFWDSPWGNGRPGWHIECSCMSLNHLHCETLDIHGGGLDLQFPHHENEIAQAEALTGKPFAKYWIHHGLLTINKQKMSKSLGNFITIEEAVKRYGADALKIFFLSAHYTSSIDFSDEKMSEVARQREKILTFLTRARDFAQGSATLDSPKIFRYRSALVEAMDDDFNTAKALGLIFDFMGDMNKVMDQNQAGAKNLISTALNVFDEFLFQIFHLDFQESSLDAPAEIVSLLEQRMTARAQKDFAESDRLRDLLSEKGYVVQDMKDGQVWRKR
jgi:cysteinyl-tRNA synthetase